MERESVKWRMPGWRIEQKFSSNTLIGNWLEERQKVSTELYIYRKTHPRPISTTRAFFNLGNSMFIAVKQFYHIVLV